MNNSLFVYLFIYFYIVIIDEQVVVCQKKKKSINIMHIWKKSRGSYP